MARLVDRLVAVLGRLTALVDVCLLFVVGGHTVTNAASGAGTALNMTRTWLDFGDAGIDQLRLTVRGNNSAVGTVVVSVHDVTNNVELCRVTLSGTTVTTYAGAWTPIEPTGEDVEVEARVIGDGAFDPVLYAIHLQGRTLQART